MGFHCQSDAPEGWSKEREAGKATRCVCLSVETVWTAHASWTRDTYFSEEPRDQERRFAPWSFCFFKRVISLRSLRESVFFVYISLCSKRVTLARINCPHVSLSMDGQCVWWISGGARAETLHCARGEFSPLKMRTELKPHLWLTLTVSCLPVFSLGFVPVLGFPPSERTEIQLDGLSITGSFFRFATNYCHNLRKT